MFGLPRRGSLFCSGLPCFHLRKARWSSFLRRSFLRLLRGESRASQVTGPSSSHVPWPSTSPAGPSPRPLAVTSLLPSGPPRPWAEPEFPFRWLAHHGPRVRLPTHQRSRYRERCKADYRPAGLSFGRAGFAPAGRLFRISRRHRLTSYPNGPAGPGRIRRRESKLVTLSGSRGGLPAPAPTPPCVRFRTRRFTLKKQNGGIHRGGS